MAYDGGYIMLHRRIKHWKWFKEPATVVVWLTLLLSAEWRQGATLKPGQVALTQREIMELTGLSRQQIRTALKHLEATKEITVSATKGLTSQASLITIEKWEQYQTVPTMATKDATQGKTEDATFLPLYKKNKEIKEIKEDTAGTAAEAVPMPDEFKAKMENLFGWNRKDN